MPRSNLRPMGVAIEPLYGRAQEASRIEGRLPGLPWAVMQRIDLPNPKPRQYANPRQFEQWRKQLQGAIGDYGYALRPAGPRSAQRWTMSISMPASPSTSISCIVRRRRPSRDFGQGPKPCAARCEHPFRLRSLGRDRHDGGEPEAMAGHRRELCRVDHRCFRRASPAPSPFDGRVIHAAGGGFGGAGACLRPCLRRRLSARFGARRHHARRCASLHLFPPRRESGPVPDHRQVPSLAEALGPGCRGLRA